MNDRPYQTLLRTLPLLFLVLASCAWRAGCQRPVRTLTQIQHLEEFGPASGTFTAKGFISGGFDGKLLWHNPQGFPKSEPTAQHPGPVDALIELPGGSLLSATGGAAFLRDADGTLLAKSPTFSSGRLLTLAAVVCQGPGLGQNSGSGGACALAGDDRGNVYRLSGPGVKAQLFSKGLSGGVRSLVGRSDGGALIGLDSGELLLVASSGTRLASLQLGAGVQALATGTTADLVVAGDSRGRVYVLEAGSGPSLRVLADAQATRRPITALSLDSHRGEILTGSRRGELALLSFTGSGATTPQSKADDRGGSNQKDNVGKLTLRSQARVDFEGHQGAILSIARSEQGWCSAAADGFVRCWTPTGAPIDPPYLGHRDSVDAIAFGSGDRRLFSGGGSQGREVVVRSWSANGKPMQPPLKFGRQRITSIATSSSGMVAVGSVDSRLELLTSDGKEHRRLFIDGAAHSLAFTPDGKGLLVGDGAGGLGLYNVETGKLQWYKKVHAPRTSSVAISPDGKRLASGGWDRFVRIFDSQGKQLTEVRDHQAFVEGLAFSPDGKLLASGGWDNVLRIRDGQTAKTKQVCRGHEDWVRAVRFHPTKPIVATVADDRRLVFWDLDCRPRGELRLHKDIALALDFSADGRWVASGGRDGRVYVRPVEQVLDQPVSFEPQEKPKASAKKAKK